MLFRKTAQKVRDAVTRRTDPSRAHIAGLREDIRSRLTSLRQDRDAEAQIPLREEFSRTLAAWGIEEGQIPGVLRDLKLRLLCFALPLVLAAAVVLQAAYISTALLLFCLSACLTVSVVGVFTTLWRLWVLESRRFVPFGIWLFGLGKEQL
ncbi:MAG: hypothetical protein IJU37_10425 [Desulfovibrio sp.]|nr:hypothetical protein [Desulfovibrio sp.]